MIERRKIVLEWPEPPHVLYPEQRAALADDVGVDLCVAGVGGGKTSTGATKIVRWALGRPRRRDGTPACYAVIGRDYRLVKEGQLAEVENQLRRLRSVPFAALVARSIAGQAPMIELRNGVTILGFSGSDPDRMRGFALDGVWLDESEWQPAKAFEIALQRQRSAEAIRAIVTSSPSGSGWLWQLVEGSRPEWNELRKAVPIRIHRWGSRVAANKDEVLDAIAAAAEAVSPGKSRQELDGLFLGTKEAPFVSPFGQCESAFVERLTLDAAGSRGFVLGIDLGKSVDYTALVVLGARGHVLEIDRFNASSLPSHVRRDQFYVYVEQRVLELQRTWRIPLLKVDTAMMGSAFADGLRQKLGGVALVEGLRTDSASRKGRPSRGSGSRSNEARS